MELKQKVLSGLGWSAGGRFAGQLATWGITIVVMRLLTPGDYGLMAIAGIFISVLLLMSELGLGAALIQTREIGDIQLRQTFGIVLIINLCLFVLLILLSPLIGFFFHEERIVPIIRLLSIQFLFLPFATIPQSLLTREMNFRNLSLADFISTLSGGGVTLLLAINGWGVWSLVLGSTVLMITKAITLNVISPFLCMPILSFKNMAHTMTFGGYVTASNVLWGFYTQSDSFLIGKFLGKEVLGFYSVGVTIASLPMEKVSGIINQVAFPAFSSVQTDPQKAGAHFLKAVRVMSFISFPVLWGMSSIAPELVNVLLGSKWGVASLPFQLISLLIPIRMISNLMSSPMLGMGRADINFYNALTGFIIMPLAILTLMHWGLFGVCLAWLICFPIVFLLNLHRASTVLRISLSDVLLQMIRPAAAALFMYCVVLSLKAALGNTSMTIWHLVLLITSGTAAYSAAIAAVGMERVREAWGLIRA